MVEPRATGGHPGEMSNSNGEHDWRPCCPNVLLIKVQKRVKKKS